MKRVVIIILTALLVLSAFVSCNEDKIIDDEFSRTVTFDANGGQGTMEPQQMTTRTLTALALNKFTLTDHHFHGWNTKVDGSGLSYGDGEQVSLTEDVTLYAMWEHDKAFITFDKNGGAGEMRTQIVLTNTPAELYANEYGREGYGFIGWNTKADGSGKSYRDKAEITVTTDTTLYAQWTDQTVTVTFYPNGGEGEDYSQDIFAGAPTALVAVQFTKEDYHFVNWDTTAEGEGHAYGDGAVVTITEDLELYAQWSHDTVKVTFDANGGTGEMKDQVVDTNTPTALNKEAFIKTDHHFTNWDTTAAGEGDAYGDGEKISISKDTTLYAQWAHDTAKITFDANGGEGTMEEQEIDTNTPTAIAENEFEFEGRTFTYWNTEKDGSGTYYADKAEITIEADITLYAQWDKVTITFRPNGGVGEDHIQIVDKNTETELDKTTFFKLGYEFGNWNTMKDDTGTSFAADAKVTIENDLVLYAIWERLPIIFIDENTKVLIGGESYMIRKDVTIEKRLTIDGTGDVSILLPENLTLDLENGISVAKKQSLIIEGEGTLKAKGNDNNAAIGSNSETDAGTITINGGNIIADGSIYAAGIGGGAGGNGAKVYLNGGTITATGGQYAPAIGGGDKSESDGILAVGEGMGLYGGESDKDAEFISIPTEGYEGDLCMYMYAEATEYVTVSFDANEGEGTMAEQTVPSGIEWKLNANEFTHETLFFAGWATSEEGDVVYTDQASVKFTEDTTLYAKWIDVISLDDTYGGNEGKKLTGGLRYTIADDLPLSGRLAIDDTAGDVTLILPKGKTLTLEKGLNVAEGQALVIEGEGTLVATGDNEAAGIGGGSLDKGGTITIKGGTINATGGDYAAGIGGGMNGEGGDVTILGGTVTANGGDDAVGIGGGYQSTGSGTLTIGAGYVLTGGNLSVDTILLGPVDEETTYTGASHPRYMNVSTASEIKDSTSAITLKSGVYTTDATDTEVVVSERITVEGSVFLLLPDGVKLTASNGITVSSGNTLVIDKYGSTVKGTGILNATSPEDISGIGGDKTNKTAGTIIINNGVITATSVFGGAGIGGGIGGAGGTITINGGTVTATGGWNAAGIGGGNAATGGIVTINGGTVTATGGWNAAGIGGGYDGTGGIVTINGGTVKATGEYGAAGVGGGIGGAGGTITINGGTVTANGGDDAVGIGGGYQSTGSGTLTIADGVIMMVSTNNEDWIEYDGSTRTRYMKVPTPIVLTSSTTAWTSGNVYTLGDENVKIESRITVNGTVFLLLPDGKTLNAQNGITVASGNTLVIDKYGTTSTGAGILNATGPDDSAGIGGVTEEGKKDAGTVIIIGGTVYATGGGDAAGIGGCLGGNGGTVIINGGTVDAQGGEYAAGIGGGVNGVGGTVTITGGRVTANGGDYGAGIGGGWNGDGGTVIINGGAVTANGGFGDQYLVAGIGAGSEGSSHGTLKIGTGMALYGDPTSPAQTKISDATESYTGDRYRYMLAKQPGK